MPVRHARLSFHLIQHCMTSVDETVLTDNQSNKSLQIVGIQKVCICLMCYRGLIWGSFVKDKREYCSFVN